MDYRRRILAAVFVGLNSVVIQASSAPAMPVAASWLHSSKPLDVIASTPIECLNPAAPKAALLGRLVFESPALLGGQSARMGLSCSSCHLAGRGNPHFYLDGISGAPGTADVSQSFLSTKGGNDNFSPRLIPDLAIYAQRTIKDRNSELFEAKLRQLIEVEFDGQEALPLVFDVLLKYLANIDQQYCESLSITELKSWQNDWQRLSETIGWLHQAVEADDDELSKFLVRVGRYRLENLYRAFDMAGHKGLNAQLVASSRGLEHIGGNLSKQARLEALFAWKEQSKALIPILEANHKVSAYSVKALQQLSKGL